MRERISVLASLFEEAINHHSRTVVGTYPYTKVITQEQADGWIELVVVYMDSPIHIDGKTMLRIRLDTGDIYPPTKGSKRSIANINDPNCAAHIVSGKYPRYYHSQKGPNIYYETMIASGQSGVTLIK